MKVESKSIAPKWVTFELENEEGDPSFYIKPLSNPELTRLRDFTRTDPETLEFTINAEGQYFAIKKGLLGWKGLEDDNGIPKAFSTDWNDVFEFLPPYLVRFIAIKIYVHSVFSEEDEKKLLRRLKSIETEEISTAPTASGESTVTTPTPAVTPSS